MAFLKKIRVIYLSGDHILSTKPRNDTSITIEKPFCCMLGLEKNTKILQPY